MVWFFIFEWNSSVWSYAEKLAEPEFWSNPDMHGAHTPMKFRPA